MARPLVASDVPGCRDIVEEGVTGTLCAARDARSLAQAMERIARLPASGRRALGESARRRVQQRFSEEIVVDAYLRVLDELNGRR